MKKFLFLSLFVAFAMACGNSNSGESKSTAASADQTKPADGNPSYDQKRGEGKFSKVEVGATLDVAKADAGTKVYTVKCSACHKLTDEKLVGPGWKDVTKRRAPEWIMNFVTNTDEMLQKDAVAKNLYEVCLVKMPNQNLSDNDARAIMEFQRNNDGDK